MAAPDKYKPYAESIDSPAQNAASVTPSDTNDLGAMSRSVYVGIQGDLAVIMAQDSRQPSPAVTVIKAAVGLLPIRVSKILATGTTAASITTFW